MALGDVVHDRARGLTQLRDLLVWRKAFALCVEVYRLTEAFPSCERFGLSAELV